MSPALRHSVAGRALKTALAQPPRAHSAAHFRALNPEPTNAPHPELPAANFQTRPRKKVGFFEGVT